MRRYFAEFLATFLLVFAVAGAIVADQQLAVVQVRDSFGPLGVALAYGLGLAVAIAAVARISGGHANPAVSLAFFVTGRMNAKDLLGYVSGQLLGGLAAAFLVKRLFLAQAVDQAGVGVPALQDQMSLFQGIAIEIVLTFLLVLVIWGVAVDPRGPKVLAPLAIGVTLTMAFLVGAAFTGAALNPARWLGSAAASGQFQSWPVWIVGPTVGALLAALLYESLFLTDAAEAEEGDISETYEPGKEDEERQPVPAGADGRSETAAAASRISTEPESAATGSSPPPPTPPQPPSPPAPAVPPVPPPPPPPPAPPAPESPAPSESSGSTEPSGGQARETPEQPPAPGSGSSPGDGVNRSP